MIRLAAHLFILLGAVNTGVLTSGDKAILFDCCDTVTLERLADIGINRVDKILCTQHRRSNISGAYAFVNEGTQLIVPAAERDLIAKPEEYWNNPKNRWHIYSFQPSPEVLISGLPVHKVVRENDVIEWEGYRIHVLDTPGATMGAVSYFVESDGKKFCFSGDVLYGPGQIWDFYSLQKGYKTRDYHAFLGNLPKLKLSLNKLEKCGATVLIPSHGKIINNPAEAARLTTERLDEVWRNYSCISSILYYFPNAMADGENDPDRMHPAPTHPEISFLKRIPKTTTFVLKSLSGAALVIDCGKDGVVKSLKDMIKTGEISSVDGVWITHYHDDHVDGLQKLCKIFNCPVMTIENIVEILEHPRRFILPCLSDKNITVSKAVKHGEKWQWKEFILTSFHFPGQTYYHSGLLAEGRGKRIFFGGDSFSPCGIDDYCAYNRNFLGEGRGFNKCLDILRELNPDIIINPHQDYGIQFLDEHIDYMQSVLLKREKLFAKILPWEHPNFGTDPFWVRTYPYEQDAFRGRTLKIQVFITNHADNQISAEVEPFLSKGLRWEKKSDQSSVYILPHQDESLNFSIFISEDTNPGRYIIPFRITLNNRYLGQFRHAMVNVK